MDAQKKKVMKERIKEAEEEAKTKKKPTHEEEGKLVKEAEDEAEAEAESKKRCKEAEDESEDDLKPSMRKEAEDEDESEDEDEDTMEKEDEFPEEDETEESKKKRLKAQYKAPAGQGVDPTQSGQASTSEQHTITPGYSTPSQPQDVFVPQSVADGKREQMTPMAYAKPLGKSAQPDLMKSPLYLGISSQIDGIRETLSKKLEAIEKSMNDRLSNVLKNVEAVEKFNKKSFYKMYGNDETDMPEEAESFSKKLSSGKARFSQ